MELPLAMGKRHAIGAAVERRAIGADEVPPAVAFAIIRGEWCGAHLRQIVARRFAVDRRPQQADALLIVRPMVLGIPLQQPDPFGKPAVREFAGAEVRRRVKRARRAARRSRRSCGRRARCTPRPARCWPLRPILCPWRWGSSRGRHLALQEISVEADGVQRVAHVAGAPASRPATIHTQSCRTRRWLSGCPRRLEYLDPPGGRR